MNRFQRCLAVLAGLGATLIVHAAADRCRTGPVPSTNQPFNSASTSRLP
jgi:hypothetical protein